MSTALDSLTRLQRAAGKSAAVSASAADRTPPVWLATLREEAFAAFREQGIPTRRLEAWKGTNLAPLEAFEFTRVGPGAETRPTLATRDSDPSAAAAPNLVFIDGRFDPSASRLSELPAGVELRSLAELLDQATEKLEPVLGRLADPKRHALVALQTAFLEDGVGLFLDADVQLPEAIRIRFVSTAQASHSEDSSEGAHAASASFPRLLVVAGARSQASLLYEHVCEGAGRGFSDFVAEFLLGAGARIETVEIQAEGPDHIHATSVHAQLERDARFDSHVFSLGTGLVRSELDIRLSEPGAETHMRGFFLGRDAAQDAMHPGDRKRSGHIDHFTTVEHAAPHCTSDQEYRGVLGGASKGVFRGRVIVRPGAEKTDARQSNPNLLISDSATIDTKPQLEIYTDDVRASHGSTIGQLDEDAVFFLRARGIEVETARLMLTRAFAHSIVDGVENRALRADVARHVDTALESFSSLASLTPVARFAPDSHSSREPAGSSEVAPDAPQPDDSSDAPARKSSRKGNPA